MTATAERMPAGCLTAVQGEVDCLDRLAGVMTSRGVPARVVALPGRRPTLEVAHPQTRRRENVYADLGDSDGRWWFWWPWAERIAADLEAAAAAILSALARPAGADDSA